MEAVATAYDLDFSEMFAFYSYLEKLMAVRRSLDNRIDKHRYILLDYEQNNRTNHNVLESQG